MYFEEEVLQYVDWIFWLWMRTSDWLFWRYWL